MIHSTEHKFYLIILLVASWDPKSSGSIPQLKGARMFTFEEVKKCTNNFAETNEIGGGGYGLVITHSVPFGHFMNYNKMRAK